MNVFLQGVPGIGKSTIIKKLLLELDLKPSGFVTLSGSLLKSGQRNVYLYPANDICRVETAENLIGERLGEGRFKAHTETFERLGTAILKKAGPPLILMDEIGFMENQALLYQKEILELLNGSIPVLGVIKAKTTPFIEEIVNHEKSVILRVDEMNRLDSYEKVLRIIEKAI